MPHKLVEFILVTSLKIKRQKLITEPGPDPDHDLAKSHYQSYTRLMVNNHTARPCSPISVICNGQSTNSINLRSESDSALFV